jgi:hypothetical protein
MKQIEDFVDSVYHNVAGNEQEIQELKAEMKSHLLEAVDELKKQGKSEQEAIAIAIERFGGEKVTRAVVGQLFQVQKIFAKRVLYLAFTCIVLTSLLCGVLWAIDKGNRNENLTVAQTLIGMVEKQEVISEELKEKIDAFVQDKDQILNLQIYKMDEVKRETGNGIISHHTNEAIPAYQYENAGSAPDWMLIDLGYDLNGATWYVQMEAKKIFAFIPFVSFAGVAVYATLFTIWATINAYHHKRLNMGWIIVFAIFNVVGYLIYLVAGKRAALKERSCIPLYE